MLLDDCVTPFAKLDTTIPIPAPQSCPPANSNPTPIDSLTGKVSSIPSSSIKGTAGITNTPFNKLEPIAA